MNHINKAFKFETIFFVALILFNKYPRNYYNQFSSFDLYIVISRFQITYRLARCSVEDRLSHDQGNETDGNMMGNSGRRVQCSWGTLTWI